MSGNPSSRFRVLLVAADAAGLDALRPTRETLAAFGIDCGETVWPEDASGSFENEGVRAVVVASPDAILPAAVAESTALPVIRVPMPGSGLDGFPLLYDAATANLPAGQKIPFATVAIGEAGAKNAALFVVAALGHSDARLWQEWLAFRQRQTAAVLAAALPQA